MQAKRAQKQIDIFSIMTKKSTSKSPVFSPSQRRLLKTTLQGLAATTQAEIMQQSQPMLSFKQVLLEDKENEYIVAKYLENSIDECSVSSRSDDDGSGDLELKQINEAHKRMLREKNEKMACITTEEQEEFIQQQEQLQKKCALFFEPEKKLDHDLPSFSVQLEIPKQSKKSMTQQRMHADAAPAPNASWNSKSSSF